ncbi:MAG TPA: electron transfer flavoprotein subunit alpha/FixB family protein [Candidatus Limnocylindrales bacterium]
MLVLVTTADGGIDKVSLQAMTLGSTVAAGGPVHALLIGDGSDDQSLAAELGEWGAAQVHVASHPALAAFAPDAMARIVDDLAVSLDADVVVGAGTEAGNTVMARAAARAGLPFAANCTAVNPGSPVTVTRLRWGGSLLEEAVIHAGRAMLTVAPHAVTATPTGGTAVVEVFTPQLDDADLAVRVVGRVPAATGGVSLAEARVVVTGGRGVGSAAGFAPVVDLAGLLGAAVGCSRAVTISGWRPHTEQVGQTGTKIAPDLYVAAGVSGATQHMAGCSGAKRVLAINKDAEAPIMSAADYAVIGDLHEVLPAISAEIRRRRGA